jgi:type I restriction enzyme S subunit
MKSEIRFSDIAKLRKETVQPRDFLDAKYVGLEHISQGTLQLNGNGFGSDVDSQKQRFYKGDILFGKLRPYFRKVVKAPFDGICSTDIWVVDGKVPTDNDFIKYWMASESFIQSSTGAAEGSRMPRAQWDWVSNFTCPITNPVLREAIGKTLAQLDEKIRVNQQIASTLEQIAQTVFKSWFVDFDPVHAKARGEQPVGMDAETAALFPDSFEDSELGPIPAGWEIETLTELAEYRNGLALQKYPAKGDDSDLPVLKIPQLKANSIDGAGFASNKVPEKFVVADGDCIFSWSGALEVRIWYGGIAALNQHLFKVIPLETPTWNAYFQTLNHLEEFRAIAEGKATTMGHIKRGDLENAKFASCPPALIKKADEVFAPLLAEFVIRGQQNRTLTQLRDSLLPRLISGELEIPAELLEA